MVPDARILVALVLIGGAAAAPPDAAEQGKALLLPFKVELKAALQNGLADGPAAAIDACRVEAPEIAERHSANGIRLGRSSHRLRNPANEGPEWIRETLDIYVSNPDLREPVVVDLGPDRTGYIEPILTAPVCLTCHGTSVPNELRNTIDAHYPEDRATGFKTGDLRGVFWVEFPR